MDALELRGHLVERAPPRHRDEVACLVEPTVLEAKQRLGQSIGTIENLGVGIAFHAEQSAVDRAVRITLDGDDPAGVGGNLDAATDATETADALVPGPLVFHRLSQRACSLWELHARRCRRGGGDAHLEKVAASRVHHVSPDLGPWRGASSSSGGAT